jgi:hypothetical protein
MTSRWRLLGTVFFACGCNGTEPIAPSVAPIPVAPAAPANRGANGTDDTSTVATEPTEKHLAGVTVTIPAGWEERPLASDVLLAEYRLTGVAGPARLTMSSTGGGIEANLARWQTQFTRTAEDAEPTRSTVSVDGAEAVILELQGTFRDGFSGGDPQPGWCMLGAAIPTGPATFFIKLTGPRDTVFAHRDEFQQLVKTARLEH